MVAQKPLEDQLIGLSDRPGSPLEVHAEPTARWVRAVVDGVAVADSKQVLTVTMGLPVYYFPRGDVRADLLVVVGAEGVARDPRRAIVLQPQSR